ncbi:DUF3455 domain-containing protein [Methylocapsa palsarum]|uniref:DUF3455 domain-containing protein n=1 Tax=Methylocapsa palsarum TaxID=1612308 RepID=A0A1I3YNN3_9HYPH|nr:DUF3455 domain-containing protein [Methylocapsa palsarum]SFK32979.1 Protein of unknown function [Methylocapsa palsarum]
MRRLVWTIALCGSALPAAAEEPLAASPGAKLLFAAQAQGVQIYSCQAKDPSGKDPAYGWVLTGPQAVLTGADGRQIGVHSKGPSWILADGSKVTGAIVAKGASPQEGAIPWLLLRVDSHEGSGRLDGVSEIRRLNTSGGAEPGESCTSARAGEVARVPYSATYEFYGT